MEKLHRSGPEVHKMERRLFMKSFPKFVALSGGLIADPLCTGPWVSRTCGNQVIVPKELQPIASAQESSKGQPADPASPFKSFTQGPRNFPEWNLYLPSLASKLSRE